MTEIDIRSTLASVCRKVTRDKSVDEASRSRRMQALLIMGEVFQEVQYNTIQHSPASYIQ